MIRAQDGDTASFGELVRRHQQTMYRLAVRMLGSPTDAQDAVQEAFLAAWRQLPGFRGGSSFGSWLYRIVTTRCLNLLRSRRRRPASAFDQDAEPTSLTPGPERETTTSSAVQALVEALKSLPPEQRICWVLREGEGLGYEEIAQVTGTSPDAVRGRIHRARRTLATSMQDLK